MKSPKFLNYTFVFILLLAVGLVPVSALSASPASKLIVFNASEVVRYDITIHNDESSPLTIGISPVGVLAAEIDVPESISVPVGESRSVPVRVRLPQTTVPGTTESGILFESRSSGGSTVAASSAVQHVIRVQTPKEGSYLTAELLSSSGIVGSEVLVTLHILNVGTQSVTTTPSLLLDGVRQEFQTVTLAAGESVDLVASWHPRAIGVYTAVASIPYGSTENRVTAEIVVGTLAVRITNIGFGDFQLGDPFRVSVDALNEWGDTLPVLATFELKQGGVVLSTSKVAAQMIGPLAESRFTGFLETAGATAGPATMEATLSYADRKTVESRELVLSIDSLTPVSAAPPPVSSNFVWWIVLFIVVLVVLVYFIYRARTPRAT